MPLGDRYSEIKLCRHMMPGLATRGIMWKHKKCDSFLNNDRSSMKFLWQVLLGRSQLISSGFLIWPSFQGHRGQSVSPASPFNNGGTFCNRFSYSHQTWYICSPIGDFYLEIESWRSMNPGLATRGRCVKTQKNVMSLNHGYCIISLKHCQSWPHVSTWSVDHFIWN